MTVVPAPAPMTASEHEARAFEMMAQIRAMARRYEGFNFAPKGRRAQISVFVTLPDEFFELMALACDSNPDIEAAGNITATEMRTMLTASRANKSVVVEMQTQARGMDDTFAEFRGDVGKRTLNAYEIAKRLNKQNPRQTLIPYLGAIRRALGRGRRPKREAPPDGAVTVPKA